MHNQIPHSIDLTKPILDFVQLQQVQPSALLEYKQNSNILNAHSKNKSQRLIKNGDVVIRLLIPYMVWHYGIVVKVNSQNANDILILEFSDDEGIKKSTLAEFMFGRLFFWVNTFHDEKSIYGKDSFFSIGTRIQRAYNIYKKNNLSYNMMKYNCEYYVRKCVFRHESLWESKQTYEISKSVFNLYSKLLVVFAFNMLTNLTDCKMLESDSHPTKHGYRYCRKCHSIFYFGNKSGKSNVPRLHDGNKKYNIIYCDHRI